MRAFYEKHSLIIKKILTVLLLILAVYIVVTKLFPLFAPFIVAFLIALLIEPMVDFLNKRIRLPRGLASLISILLTVSVLGTLVTLLFIKGYQEAWDLATNITNYVMDANNEMYVLYYKLQDIYVNLPPEVFVTVQENLSSLSRNVSAELLRILKGTVEMISALPRIGIFILITLISAYFMSSDRVKIRQFIYKQVSQSSMVKMQNIKTDILSTMVGYVKAYAILLTLTFVEVSIGLSLIGVKYAVVLALLISIVDILPILGTGTVLIPWAIWCALTRDLHRALFLLILYIVVLLVRQLFEPKIVGSQVGLHPLVTLMSMYVGLSAFGVVGMLLGPIIMILLKNLQKAGLIKLWNDA